MHVPRNNYNCQFFPFVGCVECVTAFDLTVWYVMNLIVNVCYFTFN